MAIQVSSSYLSETLSLKVYNKNMLKKDDLVANMLRDRLFMLVGIEYSKASFPDD